MVWAGSRNEAQLIRAGLRSSTPNRNPNRNRTGCCLDTKNLMASSFASFPRTSPRFLLPLRGGGKERLKSLIRTIIILNCQRRGRILRGASRRGTPGCRAGGATGLVAETEYQGSIRGHPPGHTRTLRDPCPRHLAAETRTSPQDLQRQGAAPRLSGTIYGRYPGERRQIEVKTVKDWLLNRISQLTNIPPDRINTRHRFVHYGIDSVTAASLSGELSKWLGQPLPAALVYDYPNIDSLARYVSTQQETTDEKGPSSKEPRS